MQQPAVLEIDCSVTLACDIFQTIDICDLDVTPCCILCPLQCRNEGHAVASHADHLSKKLLGQRQYPHFRQIMHPQESTCHARFRGVRCITCGGLLSLCEQGLLMTNKRYAKSPALVGDGSQAFNFKSWGDARMLNDGVG